MKCVTVSEQRQRFFEDYQLNYYCITELAERFGISRRTAHKWINRYKQFEQEGYQELSRRPHTCPWQTDEAIVEELVKLRKAHPRWGPRKLLNLMERRDPKRRLPAIATAARILAREGLVKPRRRYRRAHPGCPKSIPQGPNDIWAADYKGQFRLKNGKYCFPLTVSDLSSRFLLGVDAHPNISLEKTVPRVRVLFDTYGLRNRIRTDNGTPISSNALARLSQLSVWFIKLGIYPELIEPRMPRQNKRYSGCRLWNGSVRKQSPAAQLAAVRPPESMVGLSNWGRERRSQSNRISRAVFICDNSSLVSQLNPDRMTLTSGEMIWPISSLPVPGAPTTQPGRPSLS